MAGESNAGRNLLFGILALQNNLVDRAGLLDGFNRWVDAKSRPLGQILVERGAMAADECALLEALVAKHLQKFGGDAERSLEAVSSVGSVREDLGRIGDAEFQASLAHVSAARAPEDDPNATIGQAHEETLASPAPRFRILRPHAKGGLGQVSVALDRELDRSVALKEIQERHADDPQSRARFVREAEITGKLEHPGIVPIYGLGHDLTGRPFYAMRFIRGDSLKEAIASFHDLPRAQSDSSERSARLRALLRRFTDVCNAVAYAHSRGVLHRDLKPGNVMLGPFGETLVVDWGLAKPIGETATAAAQDSSSPQRIAEGPIRLSGQSRSSEETVAGTPIGTPAYASPEQVTGNIEALGTATDVYGLGAILYSLLTGKPPVQSDDLVVVVNQVTRGEIIPPRAVDPTIPKPLEAICRKAMALEALDRYRSARDLAKDIERWLDDLPVSAYPEPLLSRCRRWLRNHRTAAAAGLSAAVVALAALGIWVRQAQLADLKRGDELSLRILGADIDSVRSLAESDSRVMSRIRPKLISLWRDPNLEDAVKFRLALALGSSDPDVARYLQERVLQGDPRVVRVIAETLQSTGAESAIPYLWTQLEDSANDPGQRFRAACALAILDSPSDQAELARWTPYLDLLVSGALGSSTFPGDEIDRTLSHLDGPYLSALARRCIEGDAGRTQAFRLLRTHAERSDGRDAYFEQSIAPMLTLDADPEDFEWLLKILERDSARAADAIISLVTEHGPSPNDASTAQGPAPTRRRARALIALARLGRPELCWAALGDAQKPDIRGWLTHDLGRFGVNHATVLNAIKADRDPLIRPQLVMALAGFQSQPDGGARRDVELMLRDWYRNQSDPALHGAIAWLFRARWGLAPDLLKVDSEVHSRDPVPNRGWFVNGQNQTLTVVRGPVRFQMGAARDDDDKQKRVEKETLHERVIPRSFAIATTEVTVAQFRAFLKDLKKFIPEDPPFDPRVSPTDDSPWHGAQWFEAILYCRWLSEQEKIPENEMCFPPIPEIIKSLQEGKLNLSPATIAKTGYRLPSEAEWEFACRAGSSAPWFFGREAALLTDFANFLAVPAASGAREADAQRGTKPVGLLKPNDFGLFDVCGNLREWCLDAFKPYPDVERAVAGKLNVIIDTTFKDPEAAGDWFRVVRGGCFVDPAEWTRSAYRNAAQADQRILSTGFRVARTVR